MANNVLKEELVLNSSNFDKNINNVIRKVEELKHKGKNVGGGFDASMGKMIQKATGFNGSLGSLIGVVGKFAGALGVAMTASEAFNKVIHSSQALTDNFGATQQEVTTVVDNFFQSLASGDFSPFLNGMDNIIAKAREAYNAMDDLWNMAQSFGVQNARLNNKFQQNLNEIRAKKNSKDPNDKKRVKELTEENNRIIKQQAEGGVKLYNQTISALQSEIAAGTGMNSKITEGAIYRIVENDINNLKGGRARYKKEYKKYLEEQKKLQAKYSKKRIVGGGGGLLNKMAAGLNPENYGPGYQRELNKLQSKYGEAIAANYLLERKSDEELQEFNNTLMQGIHYQGVAISNQSKMLRYANNSASGGTSGGRGSSPKPTRGGGGYTSHVAEYKKEAETVQEIEDNITVLSKKLKDTKPNSEEYKNISAEIEKWKNLLDTTPKPTFIENATVIKDINSNISILQDRLDNTVKGSEEWLAITKQIKDETKKLRDYQDGSLSDLQNQVSEIEDKLKNENLSIPIRFELIDKKDKIQAELDNLSDDAYITVKPITSDRKRRRNSVSNAQTNVDNIVSDYNSGLLDFSEAQSQINEINEQLHYLGLKPIEVHLELETDTEKLFADIEKGANSFMSVFNGIDSVIGNMTSLAQSINEGANAWDIFIGVIQTGVGVIETVSTVLNSLNNLQELFGTTSLVAAEQNAAAGASEVATAQGVTASKSGEAIAGATASGAKMPFPYNLVAIAMGVAAVVAALATITGAYANGGVVGGSQYAGDALLARVNSGEMILTGSQQKNLFNLLDKGATSNISSGNVNFVIRGNDLHGVLQNYNSKMKKVR